MADLGVFFDALTGLELRAIVLDVVISIEHTDEGTATENPVGAQLKSTSDHFVNADPRVVITAFVTDHRPGFDPAPGRAYDVWRALLAAKRAGRRLGFVSGLEVYQEGLITSVGGPENMENEESATLTIGYKVINVATSATSELPAPPVATKTGRKRGGQNTKPPSVPKQEEGSIIYEAFFK